MKLSAESDAAAHSGAWILLEESSPPIAGPIIIPTPKAAPMSPNPLVRSDRDVWSATQTPEPPTCFLR